MSTSDRVQWTGNREKPRCKQRARKMEGNGKSGAKGRRSVLPLLRAPLPRRNLRLEAQP